MKKTITITDLETGKQETTELLSYEEWIKELAKLEKKQCHSK